MSIKMKTIKSETKRQADTFGLIRFLSSIIIIIFHYNKLTGGLHTDPQQPWYSILQLAYTNGGNLVELFFIISGFCFVLFYRDKVIQGKLNFKEFIMHRLERILPSYWLSTIMIIIFGTLSIEILGSTIVGAGGNVTDLKYLPFNIVCLNFAHPINGVAWFLAVNLICYSYYYVLYYVVKKNKNYELLFLIASVIGASICVYLLQETSFQNIARGIAAFGMGMGVAGINNAVIDNRRKQLWIGISSMLLLIMTLCLMRLLIFSKRPWIVEVYVLYPAIIFMVTNITRVKIFLSKPLMKKLGAYSYTIYVFQIAFMVILYFTLGLMGNFNWYSKINFLVALGTLIGFGILMYYIWDKPIAFKIKHKEEKSLRNH